MKKSMIMLTMAMTVSVILTGCGFQKIENPETDSEIHIATIQTQTEHAAPKPAPTTETQPQSESVETTPEEMDSNSESDTNPQVVYYSDSDFEKAIFAALLDGLCTTFAPQCYVMADADNDNQSEFMIAMPVSETSSQNIVLESPASAGIYYYDATGVYNDFFVIDPEQNKVLLNENTRSEDDYIISREYFEWQGNHWETVSLLYDSHCYWNNANVSTDEFIANAENLLQINQPEDILNICLTGDIEEITDAFYQYLSKYYKLEKPVIADINNDGHTERVLVVQNLSKNWVANIHNLYESDGILDTSKLEAMHTTCFVLDSLGHSVRIRSENFDRKYTFAESGGMLFAYDDTNSMQTIQYSDSNDILGQHFMSMMWG